MRNIVDRPIQPESNENQKNQNRVNLFKAKQKFKEDKLKNQNDKIESLKKNCPIKNSDLVIYDPSKDKCTLKECPNGFKKSADGTQCEMDMEDINLYRYKKLHKCGTQYIDWITIPNFHLGNTYFRLNTGNTKDDFNGCFEPCNIDFIPYKDIDDKNANKSKDSIHCIRKAISNVGKYGKITLDYCPLVLIILLSCDIIENNEFTGEYVKNKTNKNIEKQIIKHIKDDQLLLKEMKNEMIAQGKKYIIHLYNKYKPDFLDKIKITKFELDKCYTTTLSNTNVDSYQTIVHAYNVYKTIENNVDNYVNAYKYMSNDGDVTELIELHRKVLIWACKYTFDENTDYGKKNLYLYDKYTNITDESDPINAESEYIRKVNKNEIRNENDIFFFFSDYFNPGLLLGKFLYKGDKDDILQNPYILSIPSTIFFMILIVILLIVCVLFYKYTKPIYARLRELTIALIYGIASIFNKSIKPKYIISDLLEYVKERVKNPRKIEPLT